jgi:hypothetical protein
MTFCRRSARRFAPPREGILVNRVHLSTCSLVEPLRSVFQRFFALASKFAPCTHVDFGAREESRFRPAVDSELVPH